MGARVAPDAAPHAVLRFSKMHGAGNDFVLLDLRDGTPPPTPELSRRLADRHAGIGCDQIITIEPPRSAGAVASYRIWNSDGSNARQCGNGARCVAAWLLRDGSAHGDRFELDSPAGTHAVECLADGRFRIAMGVPQFAPQAIPLAGFADAQDEYALDVDGEAVRFGAVSMGNPHALVEVDDIGAAPVAVLGPQIEHADAFPQRCNVGFAQVISRAAIRLRVWERGVGETLACGSGACAAVAVLRRRAKLDAEVRVALPGGELGLHWDGPGHPVWMRGPAAFVFEGEWHA